MAGTRRRDVWADFTDPGIRDGGVTLTYADWAEPGVELSAGARVVAGDDEGNTALATVQAAYPAGGHTQVELRVDMATFQPARAEKPAAEEPVP